MCRRPEVVLESLLVFEPLTYSVSGRKTTEHFSISIPEPGKMTIELMEEGAEGKSIIVILEQGGRFTSRLNEGTVDAPNGGFISASGGIKYSF